MLCIFPFPTWPSSTWTQPRISLVGLEVAISISDKVVSSVILNAGWS